MHGLPEIQLYVLAACLVAAFVVELLLNRRPFVVAIAVPVALFAVLLVYSAGTGGFDEMFALIFGAMFAIGGLIASLMGSGIARALRLWIEFYIQDFKLEE